MNASEFVLDAPGGLSGRARAFLAAHASRVEIGTGPAGAAPRAQMRLHGEADDVLLRTLDVVRRRYAGLTYRSGFFDAVVRFAPEYEPGEDGEPGEILYAVETGGVTGASLNRLGEVEIGLDGTGFVEFGSLDTLIESDAMFAAAAARPAASTMYLDGPVADPAALAGIVGIAGPAERVPHASGRRTWWLAGPSADVFYCTLWHDLGLVMPPFVQVWESR